MLLTLPFSFWRCWVRGHDLGKVDGPFAMESFEKPGLIRTFNQYECRTCGTVIGKSSFISEIMYPHDQQELRKQPEGT